MSSCQSCKKPIIWLKNARTGSVNPIEAAPSPDGNLVIDRANARYRVATAAEKTLAAATGKNLYISHFATCPDAGNFRKGDKRKR
jgi:hypothetical protein